MFLAGSEQDLTFVCGCFVYNLTYQILISQEACRAGTDENQGVGVGGKRCAATDLPPGKNPAHVLWKRLGGP